MDEKEMTLSDKLRRQARMGGASRLPLKMLVSLKDEGLGETARKVWTVLGRKPAQRKYVRSLDLPEKILKQQREAVFPQIVLFSVLVPLYNTQPDMLREMIDSVAAQTYPAWELCLADGSDETHAYVGKICREYAARDSRVRYQKLTENRGISENTNACIDMAKGDYLALFDHDDLLLPNALYENARVINETGADYLYSDEMIFVSPNRRKLVGLHFKPDFAPDDLLTNNYICHLSVFKASLLEKTGAFRSAYDGSQDHDIILRLTDQAERIEHIPKVLYLWRSHQASTAGDIGSKTYAVTAGQNAVKHFLASKGIQAEVTSSPVYPTMYRVKLPIPEKAKVSVIVTGAKNRQDALQMVSGIKDKTKYEETEWLALIPGENEINAETPKQPGSAETSRKKTAPDIRLIPAGSLSPAALRNLGAKKATGDYLVFLDADLIPQDPEWIRELLMFASRENTGAVGGKLVFEEGTIRHAGIILGLGRRRTAARSHFRTLAHTGGYFGITAVAGDVTAVTAECMMIRRNLFEEAGGFDEDLAYALYDADLCLRLRKKNYLNVYTPYAQMKGGHSADLLAELGREREEYPAMRSIFCERWKKEIAAGDPYYNPNFTLDTFDFRPRVQE